MNPSLTVLLYDPVRKHQFNSYNSLVTITAALTVPILRNSEGSEMIAKEVMKTNNSPKVRAVADIHLLFHIVYLKESGSIQMYADSSPSSRSLPSTDGTGAWVGFTSSLAFFLFFLT